MLTWSRSYQRTGHSENDDYEFWGQDLFLLWVELVIVEEYLYTSITTLYDPQSPPIYPNFLGKDLILNIIPAKEWALVHDLISPRGCWQVW